MKIQRCVYLSAAILGGVLLTACDGSSGPANVNFTAFVKSVLTDPSSATPRAVNGVGFSFTDLNNPTAYSDVLPPP